MGWKAALGVWLLGFLAGCVTTFLVLAMWFVSSYGGVL